MKLSGQQIAQIREALLDAFPSKDSLRMMVRIQLDANLEEIAGGENLRVIVFNLVAWAESTGQVNALIEGASQENPGNPELTRLLTVAHAWPALTPATKTRQATSSNQPASPATIDIFLSYSHLDDEIMRPLYNDLHGAGYSVWIDEGLEAGAIDWQVAVEEAVCQARCMVVLMTPNAKGSRWVKTEVSLTKELGKRIFPVLADGDKLSAVPLDLFTAQYVDIRNEYDRGLKQRLLPAIKRYLGGADTTKPKPVPAPRRAVRPFGAQFLKLVSVRSEATKAASDPPIEFDWVTIPAGKFLMGSDELEDSLARANEMPQHKLTLPEFRIARVPVTNAQYKQFVIATNYQAPDHWRHGIIPQGKEDHPVVFVNWHDAQAFCKWANVRLPTEAEWEKAARGADGRLYPWGNTPSNDSHCNFNKNIGDTTAIGSYKAGQSPYGCLDMAGNVWEWTNSIYDSYPYDAGDGREDLEPSGFRAFRGIRHTLRGGSWDGIDWYVRCAVRHDFLVPDDLNNGFGFRVASSVLDRPGK